SVEKIDLGPINEFVVQPMMWVMSGLKTAADGFVAAGDSFDIDGYQIRVSHDVGPAITEASVGELLIPAGTCGTGGTTWHQ
ncbi:hypothetical protein NL499_28790, partial [Klebsiella pneumoniae]|nr:hypothetical protein [Klebsiella pneumoniae]